MARSPTRTLTLEDAITVALSAGQEDAAAALLRRAFGRDPEPRHDDLPELLEELTEYFLSLGRSEDAVAAAGTALLVTAARAGHPQVLRRRCRMAEILLRAGLADEACAVYAAVAQDTPGERWVHEAAGSDYLDVGDHELAFAWLTAGLEDAVAGGDTPTCIARLLGLRRVSMGALGLGPDDLDRRASALVAVPTPHPGEVDDILVLEELDRDGVAPDRALRLLECLRRPRRKQ